MSGFKVAGEACDECLFSRRSIVSPERRRQVLAECAREDRHFVCHKFTAQAMARGESLESRESDVCCRAFYDANPQRTNLMRIAERLGAVEFVPLPEAEPC